jgi:hypothetical protein
MKPSEVFEGENSSLRKTFNEVVREELVQEIADCFSGAGIHYHAGKLRTILSCTILKADLLEWANESKKQNLHNKAWDEYAEGYNTALQDLKKFISGE